MKQRKVFTCEELETGRFFLQEDLDTACYTKTHYLWQLACGVPFMGLYTLGIPFFAFMVLYSHREQLDDMHVKLKYGFLYDGYERQYYFWELWVMVRKISIVFVTVFVERYGTMSEALSGLAIGNFALVCHLRCQPYEDESLDRLESYSLYATCITLLSGLFFASGEITSTAVLNCFVGVILAANLAFVIYFGVQAFKEYRHKAIDTYIETKSKVLQIKEDMRGRATKTEEQKKLTLQKREMKENLELKYREWAEIKHEMVMNAVEIEEAQRKIKHLKEQSSELLFKKGNVGSELRDLLRTEIAQHLNPNLEVNQKRSSVVWGPFEAVRDDMEGNFTEPTQNKESKFASIFDLYGVQQEDLKESGLDEEKTEHAKAY